MCVQIMNAQWHQPIHRRQAILGIAGLLGGMLVPAHASTIPERKILLNRVHIAGWQYHKGMDLGASIQVGDRLDLFAEPDNPFDHYAVAFHWKGHNIGYVPRNENKHLSRLVRQECPVIGIVTKNDPEFLKFDSVRADVFLVMK